MGIIKLTRILEEDRLGMIFFKKWTGIEMWNPPEGEIVLD